MVVLVVLLLGTILQAVFRHFEIKKINELAYGQTVNVDGRKMKVEVVGNGTKTIVILPALGVPSPILEFRQLAGLLSEHFTVITIDIRNIICCRTLFMELIRFIIAISIRTRLKG